MSKQPSISYKDAGVDIDAGEALVERIKGVAKRTARPEVMGGLGGFGGLFDGGKQNAESRFFQINQLFADLSVLNDRSVP